MPYQGRQPGVGVRNRFIFTATSGQTSFSGADSNGLTLKYPDATYTDVFLNGALLIPVTDYAATTNTSVVLSSGAAASDVLEVVAYDISSIANAVPTSGGTFTGPLTVEGNFTADGGTIKLDGNYPVGTENVALGDTALDSVQSGGNYNVAIGDKSLTDNTTGDQNTAVGRVSLTNNTTGGNNVAIGGDALFTNTTGGNNVAVGKDSLSLNTTASNNTAVGYRALQDNTTGSPNTAVGYVALPNNTTGASNTALGYIAMGDNTTGGSNVALGHQALTSNTTASNNTAVGYQALYDNTTGSENAAFGGLALANATTAANNAAFGFNALGANTTGTTNVAMGKDALRLNTTASSNTAVGYQALYSNTTSTENVAIGYQALFSQTTAQTGSNTAVGHRAGVSTNGYYNSFFGYKTGESSSGYRNTFIGHAAGISVTSGNENTILGTYTGNQGGLDIRTSSNNIVLSDGDGNPRTKISGVGQQIHRGDENGNLGDFIASWTMYATNTDGLTVGYSGVTPNNTARYFYRGGDASVIRYIVYSNGNVVNTNNSYGATSDVKLKENIIDASSQWDDIKALTVRKYSMKSDELDAPNMLGVIAQEVEAAGMSGLINDTPDFDKETREDLGTVTKTVNYSILYMKAVKALQEAMTRIEALETKVTALEGA